MLVTLRAEKYTFVYDGYSESCYPKFTFSQNHGTLVIYSQFQNVRNTTGREILTEKYTLYMMLFGMLPKIHFYPKFTATLVVYSQFQNVSNTTGREILTEKYTYCIVFVTCFTPNSLPLAELSISKC